MDTAEFKKTGHNRKDGYGQKVYVTPEEREFIHGMAERCGISVSSYMRSVALGYSPASAVDLDAVRMLLDVNADQTRLGNLLKMWLMVREKYNETQMMSVARLLEKIGDAQNRLRTMIDFVLKTARREDMN